MERIKYRVNVKNKDTVAVFIISDVHVGAGNFAVKAFKKSVDFIAKHPAVQKIVIVNGDCIDAIHLKDPRFSAGELPADMKVKELQNIFCNEMKEFRDLIQPIAKYIKFIVPGNHEGSVIKHNSFDVLQYLLDIWTEKEKPQVLGVLNFIRFDLFRSGKQSHSYTLCIEHGSGGGGGIREGYIDNKVADIYKYKVADWYVVSHFHRQTVYPMIYKDFYGKHVRWYGATGCFLEKEKEGSTGYFEGREGQDSSIGFLYFDLKTTDKKTSDTVELRRVDYVEDE